MNFTFLSKINISNKIFICIFDFEQVHKMAHCECNITPAHVNKMRTELASLNHCAVPF